MVINKSLKQFFLSTKSINQLSKYKIDELTKIIVETYKCTLNDLPYRFIDIVCSKSIALISSAKIYTQYNQINNQNNNIVIPKSSVDLTVIANEKILLENIYSISQQKFPFNFGFKNSVLDKSLKPKSVNKIYVIINIFFNPFKKKIFLDFIKLKLYFKLLFNGISPQFFIKEKHKLSTSSFYDRKLRINLFENAKKIYETNLLKYKNIDIEDIYLLFALMPINIVENFNQIYSGIKKKEKKNLFKLILGYQDGSDETNFWIANQVINMNSKLSFYQHGASYNFLEYDWVNRYQESNSNIFYSWVKKESNKVKHFSFIKKIKKNIIQKNDLLLINNDWPFFSSFQSGPLGGMIEKNRNEQLYFLNNINYTNKILIKRPPNLYKGHLETYKKSPHSKYLTNNNIFKLIENTKIPVLSYIGTPFFEMMANDIPFLLFCKFSENTMTKESSIYMKKFKSFGFWHHSGKSAADFLNKNHHNFLNLWRDKKVIEFRNDFKNKFCSHSNIWHKSFLE